MSVGGPDDMSWRHAFWALPAWLVHHIDWSAYQQHGPQDEADPEAQDDPS
ncbi:hypothetical protein ACGF0D_35130 [Kitasatospora sp. NPDC048298]